MPPTLRPTSAMRASIERNIIYFSLGVQASLSLLVVCFCAIQLHRCPIGSTTLESQTGDDSLADSSSCPRALYTNIMVGTISYWFPAPWYAFVNAGKEPEPHVPTRKRTTTKAKPNEVTVEEVDEELK